MNAPYADQSPEVVAQLCHSLEEFSKSKKGRGGAVKKTKFSVAGSRDGLTVDSWKVSDYEYKRRDLPTYARGLFTTRTRKNVHEIAIRGYNKFFNVGEVHETKWEAIENYTQGPYELTLKENGCIIFVSGLDDGTLLVCSKHSTGDRSDVELSHAAAGERHIERQLQAFGKTKEDLARELRARNATAVAELCDDAFEEHILAYGPEKAGLYLHGININVPEFMTYPSPLVHQFADEWGFRKVGLISMETIGEVRTFLEQCAETGAHEGRDVEGFVIRCKRSHDPSTVAPYDWFFKYKFEEPYLLYRQWRECTKALIAGKIPKIKKHHTITQEYLAFARKRLSVDPKLGKLYNQNHGIIALRNDFLEFKHIDGSDAAKFEDLYGGGGVTEVSRDVILIPIATIGCGKTTIAVALSKLFGFGHVQNDNITGTKRPPRFTKAVLEQLEDHKAVVADRNNAQKHERKQIITDVKAQHAVARMVALNFVHDNIDQVRQVTQDRVFARGDNHQTIQAATDPAKVKGIMEGFLHRFEPIDATRAPDDGFDAIIDLDPSAGSRQNLEIVVNELKKLYPNLIETDPTAEDLDRAFQEAMDEYRPDLRHMIGDRGGRGKGKENAQQAQAEAQKPKKKKPLEYMSVDVPSTEINKVLETTFNAVGAAKARFYKLLQGTRRVQPKFHVTLMHRASCKENPELWDRYAKLQAEAEISTGIGDGALGECEVVLERVVFDDRIMAIVVRLNDPEAKWHCTNKVAHITVGTRDNSVKLKESNALLERWLAEGTGEASGITDIGFEDRPIVQGVVKPVLSR
ncbi:tRNA ligase [Cryphonectria parasitica EP155]|uniref:tRNA ligase n=1 Tax=Cryphonectria parasitica (strain ATCC 38755 / EP155) TaxID=660469 RepID=A0A9P4Y5H6_CRYP1|nr:tRNA ligase [Cryphonectria parasitica EP155]KAF3766722.1 tRNA ligase [Cryphonectria parasitica EP155]